MQIGDKGAKEGVIGGPDKEIINVHDCNDLLAEEEAGVAGRRFEALAFEAFGEIVEEVPAGLFEAVDAGPETEDAGWAALETAGLVDIDFFLRGKGGVNERSCDVTLGGVQAEFGGEDHHETDSAPLDDGCPGLKEINTLALAVTTNNEAGLKLLSNAAGKTFDFENPFGRKDAHPRLTVDDGPSVEVSLESFDFKLHGFEPIELVGAAHGLSVGGGIRVGGRWFTMVDGREGLEGAGGGGWVSNWVNTVKTRWT